MPYLYTCGAKAAFMSPTQAQLSPSLLTSCVGDKDTQGLSQGGTEITERIKVCHPITFGEPIPAPVSLKSKYYLTVLQGKKSGV